MAANKLSLRTNSPVKILIYSHNLLNGTTYLQVSYRFLLYQMLHKKHNKEMHYQFYGNMFVVVEILTYINTTGETAMHVTVNIQLK